MTRSRYSWLLAALCVCAVVLGLTSRLVSAQAPKVVVKKNFVGVVAQKPWQAIQAAKKKAA